jgi:mannose-6-phosphate isomerase-like protein (cupin superfamily)
LPAVRAGILLEETDMLEAKPAISITLPEQAEVLDVFGGRLSVLCDGSTTPMMLGRQIAPPGYGVPLHVHEFDDEMFLILEGELTVFGEAGETRVGPGTTVELPRGIVHGFRNDTATQAVLMVMALPGRYALEMFRHFDRAGKGSTPLQPSEIPGIAGQYGVRFV